MDRISDRSASASMARQLRQASDYLREKDLQRLIPIAPDQILDRSEANQMHIVSLLARALRMERQRGRSGHWTYDLNRHIGLAQAFTAETRTCRSCRATTPWTKKTAAQRRATVGVRKGDNS